MATFTFDAVITDRRFFLSAWVVGQRWQHSRELDHFGTQPDTVIVLDGAIAKYADGAVLHDVLEDMVARITALENANHVVPSPFTLDAFIQPSFPLNAVFFKTTTATFTLDALLSGGGSFTLDAFLLRAASASFTFSAYLIDNVLLP